MHSPVAASAGDVCCSGASHFCVLAVEGARVLCVPVIADRTVIHRADVPIWASTHENSSLRAGMFVVRCTMQCWRENKWDRRLIRLGPTITQKIMVSLRRHRQARETERIGPGLFRSMLSCGPRLASCGRKCGAAPFA